MPLVIAPADAHSPAIAVAPLGSLSGGRLHTALTWNALRLAAAPLAATALPAIEPAGEVVLRDGSRLRFGANAPNRGVWIAGLLCVEGADDVAAGQLQGGRVELLLESR